jgi:hypothetical protein
MDLKHHSECNLKYYKDARKAQSIKKVTEKCDHKLSCSKMPIEDRLH